MDINKFLRNYVLGLGILGTSVEAGVAVHAAANSKWAEAALNAVLAAICGGGTAVTLHAITDGTVRPRTR